MRAPCGFSGCDRSVMAKGLCSGHYNQRRRGQALRPLAHQVTPQDRFWSYVEKSERCWQWTGSKDREGYARFNFEKKYRQAYRLSFEWEFGPISAGLEIDHRCHNRACVRPSHLRAVTRKQNQEHRVGAQRNSKSGIRGVFWIRKARKWHAQVKHQGAIVSAGYFDDLTEAAEAAKQLRLELFTHNDLDRKAS